ncbi:MAG: ABC transporter permease subunit, partial [Clostridia bacterium]|nr:ABC transporter permease subunit [Clostridia bacterium]
VGSAPSEIRILRLFGMYDTIWGNWIQKFHFLGMYFLVFFARFKSLSNEYMEAAYVDGASELQVLTRVMLPLVKTVFATVFLIKFVEYWNDYQTPLLYMPSYPTLAVGVYNLSYTTVGVMSYTPMRMAACIILLVPIFVLFIIFKDKLMGNLTAGGVKE